MTRICAWCEQVLGEVEPVEERAVTHGICAACSRALLREAGAPDSPDEPHSLGAPHAWGQAAVR